MVGGREQLFRGQHLDKSHVRHYTEAMQSSTLGDVVVFFAEEDDGQAALQTTHTDSCSVFYKTHDSNSRDTRSDEVKVGAWLVVSGCHGWPRAC